MRNEQAGVVDIPMCGTKNGSSNFLTGAAKNIRTPKPPKRPKIVALLKAGKEPDSPKNYHPITLFGRIYKLYERLILRRISNVIDQGFIPQQTGFRLGKSCTSQILHLTEHIKEEYKNKELKRLALIDLSSAYDTVGYKMVKQKLYSTIKDRVLVKIIHSIMQIRQFYITIEAKRRGKRPSSHLI